MAKNDAYIKVFGITRLRLLLDRLSGGTGSKRLMAEIGTFLMTNIKLRTAEGKGVDGTDFDPYSPKYAMFRKAKGHPVDKVSLFFTGSMMSSMDYEATSDQVRLYFLSTEDKSGSKNPDKAYWLNQKREFFALSDDDMNEVERIVAEEFGKIIRDY